MNYQEALVKLERLCALYDKHIHEQFESSSDPKIEKARVKAWRAREAEIIMLYGELEEIILRFGGVTEVVVDLGIMHRGDRTVHQNYVAASLFSGYSVYKDQGYAQLLKIIGKVQQEARDPIIPLDQPSITGLIQVLHRFRECCQYYTGSLETERAVQDLLWIMLRSHYDRLDREETLQRLGAKNYRPDFGIPDLRVLVEAKLIGPKTGVPDIQDEILADVPGYLTSTPHYDGIVVFVYDGAHKLRDSRRFVEDLKGIEGIIEVVIIPGIVPPAS